MEPKIKIIIDTPSPFDIALKKLFTNRPTNIFIDGKLPPYGSTLKRNTTNKTENCAKNNRWLIRDSL